MAQTFKALSALCVGLWAFGASSLAHGFEMGLPVMCAMGTTCVVQNYVDHAHTPDENGNTGAYDYTCGDLSYDTHGGTDFRVLDYRAYMDGVSVTAVADGVVQRVRDGMPDRSLADFGEWTNLKGKLAGNGVRLMHDDGWVTQYAHMRQGSVRVKPGDVVRKGDVLGHVGLSGKTEFAHLHISVEKDGVKIDPFVGDVPNSWQCGGVRNPLWAPALQETLAYRPTGLIGAGFSDTRPDIRAANRSLYVRGVQEENPAALVFWVSVYGLQKDDEQRLRLYSPDGEILAEQAMTAPKKKAVYGMFSGKKAPMRGFPKGVYKGEYILQRHGVELIRESRSFTLR